MKLPLFNLLSITTDMIELCRKDDNFRDFLNYHYIIHQQVLASKRFNSKDMMNAVYKVVNSIREKSLQKIQRRLFKMQIVNKDADLILHLYIYIYIKWFSKNRFFKDFVIWWVILLNFWRKEVIVFLKCVMLIGFVI